MPILPIRIRDAVGFLLKACRWGKDKDIIAMFEGNFLAQLQ